MHPRKLISRFCLLGAVIGSAAGALILTTGNTSQAQASNRDQFLNRSIQLYRDIAVPTEYVSASTEAAVTYPRGASPVSHLSIVIGKDANEDGIVLDWNTLTGQLIRINSPVDLPLSTVLKPMRTEEAQAMTAYWLRVLGIASTAPRWKLVGNVDHSEPGRYTARWHGGGRNVVVTIQDQTGQMLRIDELASYTGGAKSGRAK